MRRIGWIAMTVLALLVATYALALLALPGARPDFIRARMLDMPLAVLAHFAGGAVALALGPFQFVGRLRTRHLTLHRWSGRVYLTAVLCGGLAGLALSTASMGGRTGHLGFGLLAVLWLGTGAAAYVRIRAGDIAAHRRWMVRSYALTYAAVTLRIYIPLGLASGIPFEQAYPLIAWLSWVPNLLLAEWWLARERRQLAPALAT